MHSETIILLLMDNYYDFLISASETYANRTKRTLSKLHDDEILDIAQVEKKMISELGENVCVYERICSKYAEATLQKKGRERGHQWDSIFW